jgi:hypothetical protein
MDLKTIVTLSILVVFFFSLFAINNRLKKQKEALFTKMLFAFAEQNNCKISDNVRWNKSILGIDRVRNFLFFVRKTSSDEIFQQINLADFRMCRLNESSRTVSMNQSSRTVIDRIELVFSNIDKNKPDATIEFYNTAYDNLFLAGEPQIADHWSKMINVKIAELPRTN